MRHDLTFESGGAECHAWHVEPGRGAPSPAPCVVIAHGFDGVREQKLDAYAERFAAAGIAALVFDYRHFGASGGEPRQLFRNRAQLGDWRAAIDQARTLPGIDPERIALWGTSTSGGHVVRLAAEDDRIAAVVAQVPLVDGLAQLFATPLDQSVRLLWAGVRDLIGSLLGRPHTIPAAGAPGSGAAVTTPDAVSGLDRITPRPTTWRNEVLARFTLSTAAYRPGRLADRLRCPVMLCLADGDLVVPAAPALKMARVIPGVTLRRYPCGHFAMYDGVGFERAVGEQTAFLTRHLVAPDDAAGGHLRQVAALG